MASKVPFPVPPRDELVRLYFKQGMTYKDLAVKYSVSLPTLSKWFKGYGINPRKKYEIAQINGKKHKRCFGPDHGPGGELLPLNKFHKNPGKRGGVQARCIACQGKKQRVAFVRYKPWVESIYRRLGFMETTRRLGVNDRTLGIWLGKDYERRPPQTITRESAAKIIRVMGELRITGEVRHRKSIRRGAARRGEAERMVKEPRDFLIRHGDTDTEYRRKWKNSLSQERKDEISQRESEQRRLRKEQAA